MWRTFWLGILWITSISGLGSAHAVINCLDINVCNYVRVIVQEPPDINEVSQKYPRAREVDFHGNLLNGYEHPPAAQWKKLNLSYNLLTKDVFRNIYNEHLEVMDLTYNRLESVSVPPSVIEFIAERSQLHNITIGPQSKAQRMVLPKNQFDSLSIFTDLQNLEELDLSCNDLSELQVDLLPASLRTLKLARNHIHSISGSKLKSLQSLEYLDLSNNILTLVLDTHIFFPSVRFLYLQNNKVVMWMDEEKISNQLHQVNLLNNDWDCRSLNKVVNKLSEKLVPGPQSGDGSCHRNRAFICCTSADSPYVNRLIEYRKREFKALQENAAHRETGNLFCNKYEPNPCEDDDNLVFKVAGSALQDAKNLAESSLQQFEQTLNQEKNLVENLRMHVEATNKRNFWRDLERDSLLSYINTKYLATVAFSSRTGNGRMKGTVGQLQEIFGYYKSENEDLKQQISDEERRTQDKLNEIQTLEKEIEELKAKLA